MPKPEPDLIALSEKLQIDIRTLRNVSLMPAGLGDALKPEQIANIIAFLRSPP